MPQNEKLDDFNPGVDRVWGSFSNSPEQTQSPASGLDAQAALAGKAIIGSGEHETRRVNQARGIVTYGEGEPTAIAFNDKSTESGNQYVLAPMEGLVISARGDVYTDVYRLPNVEFGKPLGA